MAELSAAGAPHMTFELLAGGDGSAFVKISGELDMNTVAELEAAVEPILAGTPSRLSSST